MMMMEIHERSRQQGQKGKKTKVCGMNEEANDPKSPN